MGVWGAHPPPRKLPFRKAKRVVNCNSAGQLTGPRTIRELLSIKRGRKATDAKVSHGNF